MFSAVLGAIALTYNTVQPEFGENVSCTSDRIAAYGYTDKRAPIAELAAIANWQRDTEQKKPGYGNWHIAHKRSMKCRLYKGSAHIQCVVSALPCRIDKS